MFGLPNEYTSQQSKSLAVTQWIYEILSFVHSQDVSTANCHLSATKYRYWLCIKKRSVLQPATKRYSWICRLWCGLKWNTIMTSAGLSVALTTNCSGWLNETQVPIVDLITSNILCWCRKYLQIKPHHILVAVSWSYQYESFSKSDGYNKRSERVEKTTLYKQKLQPQTSVEKQAHPEWDIVLRVTCWW